MAQRKTLSENQVVILRWVAEGCPDGIMDGHTHRISAAALRSRGLLKIAGRGPTWTAEVTDAGREYLAQLDGPDPPTPRQANLSVTEQLVRDVAASGGVLRVLQRGWYDREGIDHENRARLAMLHGRVPDGKRLSVTRAGGELEIRLEDAPGRSNSRPPVDPVPVADRIGRYHKAARAFRESSERHEVSRRLLPRATRLVHTIAVESEKRGWSAHAPADPKPPRPGQSASKGGDLTISTEGNTFSLRLLEEGVNTRGPWERGVAYYRDLSRGRWFSGDPELPKGPYDANATGRLKLELNRDWVHRGRQSSWADRASWTLESRLPHLFREIEERIVEAERVANEQREAAERAAALARREAEERERRWRVLISQAKEQLLREQRATHLRAQADAWHQASLIRRYCDAVEAEYGDVQQTAAWIAWARAFAAGLDPLTRPPSPPDLPEAAPEDLQRFLPSGWSAHGPEHHDPRRSSRPFA